MKPDYPNDFITALQLDYDRLIKRYHDPSSWGYKKLGVAKLLRDDLRAILNLRKQQNAQR